MPTFSAITLDRLLEPATSKSSESVKPPKPKLVNDNKTTARKIPEMEKKVYAASPLLYTTPESTPLPDDDPPVSYAPSPFIVNHKRRGPRLMKSFSQGDVVSVPEMVMKDEEVVELNGGEEVSLVNGKGKVENREEEVEVEVEEGVDDSSMSVGVSSERDYVCEDFFDPQDHLSVSSSVEVEENNASLKQLTSSEFYDAYEELCSEGGSQSSLRDFESEMREIRLNLLMEIERRKKSEEALDNMLRQWERLSEQLSLAGLMLPSASTVEMENANPDFNPAEDLCQQIYLARAISISVGRGSAKAEAEIELESQIEAKNFEIARLADRLHYYEAMNHEMSQRNQEATELARRNRQRRKQRQRWIWGSIASIVLGSVVLGWSYLPSGSGSAPSNAFHAPAGDEAAQP